MSTDGGDTTKGSNQDGGATDPEKTDKVAGDEGAEGAAEKTEGADAIDPEADLCAKFSAFCDVKTKTHFTPKACNKLVKDCFEGSYKFKNTILSNRVDSSVFSKCKEKGKGFMVVNGDNCNKFLQLAAHEFAKMKKNNEKLDKTDPTVDKMFTDLKTKVKSSTGPTIRKQKQSATGNVAGLTDTKKYTGTHKLRFDESGKGRGKEGRVDKPSKSGYVGNYKGEGTFDEETQPETEKENTCAAEAPVEVDTAK